MILLISRACALLSFKAFTTTHHFHLLRPSHNLTLYQTITYTVDKMDPVKDTQQHEQKDNKVR